MLSQFLKIALFTILIPFDTFSQSVTDYREDSVCFDVVTASKIMNDIVYMERVIVSKNDSIKVLVYENEVCNTLKTDQEKKLQNKNTGLWIQGGVNFVLGILTILFAR